MAGLSIGSGGSSEVTVISESTTRVAGIGW